MTANLEFTGLGLRSTQLLQPLTGGKFKGESHFFVQFCNMRSICLQEMRADLSRFNNRHPVEFMNENVNNVRLGGKKRVQILFTLMVNNLAIMQRSG